MEEICSESDEISGLMGGIIRYSLFLCNSFAGTRIHVKKSCFSDH